MPRTGRARARLDADLVRRGLVRTREQARDAIEGGRVLVGGAQALRPSRLVDPSEAVLLVGPGPRFVGRGGDKLEAAISAFAVDVEAAHALDAGASTGGFTDCLLQRGAARVIAVDVGHGQLDMHLRSDPRVVVMERTNVRDLTADLLDKVAGPGTAPVDLVVADLSFISLSAVAPVLAGPIVRAGAALVVLVKPQFEAGRVAASRGRGVIRDPALWLAALESVASSFSGAGAAIMGAMPSPLLGASGNVEFLLYARARSAPTAATAAGATPSATAEVLRGAVREAQARTGPVRAG